ncbi:hypothetical protein CUJ87_08070 [Paraburkholderia caledonica]|nr:hypothetical protein CUJ87_08070 [Paraburkholderia caledonica]
MRACAPPHGPSHSIARVVADPRARRISMQTSTAMVRRSTLRVPKAGAWLVQNGLARGAP